VPLGVRKDPRRGRVSLSRSRAFSLAQSRLTWSVLVNRSGRSRNSAGMHGCMRNLTRRMFRCPLQAGNDTGTILQPLAGEGLSPRKPRSSFSR